ncbi:hypothetical protein [Caballeronia arationis]|uniref:hypothetical protein n=1 Tax=Caballeronia arationis TaxID=1777142 RepID=UPI001ABD9C8C|nr:hypothetical protein [Caballeronia arationis]
MYIDKADGSKRPLGVPALEDKLVQLATVEVLNAIYEQDFVGFSYGFRPGKKRAQRARRCERGYRAQKGELDTRCGYQQVSTTQSNTTG